MDKISELERILILVEDYGMTVSTVKVSDDEVFVDGLKKQVDKPREETPKKEPVNFRYAHTGLRGHK